MADQAVIQLRARKARAPEAALLRPEAAVRLRMPRTALDPVLARPEEAARHLDITVKELDAEIAAGRIQWVRFSRSMRRIDIKSVLDYERRRQRHEFREQVAEPLDAGIYFVQAGARGPIKIGFSKTVAARIRDLQTSSPLPLRLLNVRAGDVQAEHSLQVRLKRYRTHGEWFRPVAQVLEEVYA